MLVPLTTLVIGAVVVLSVLAVAYLVRDRIVDDLMLGVTALVELLLLGLAAVAVVRHRDVADPAEGATMLAYALTLPLVPPAVVFLALKEKTRWTMGVVLAGALTVAVMAYRIQQIWHAGA